MTRIAVFATHFAEYATRMAMALSKKGDVLLLIDGSNRRNELQDTLFENARRTLTMFEFRTDTRLSRRAARLLIPLRILAFRPHIVHVQEQPDPLTATTVTILKRFYPIVLTVHDPKPHAGRDEVFAFRWDHFRQRIRGAATAYHVHGAYCAGLLATVVVPRPIINTPHGVIMTPDVAISVARPFRHRVLFFGRMEEYKGLDVLLAAMVELNRRHVRIELVLAGRGPELDRLMPTISAISNVTSINRYLTPTEALSEFVKTDLVVVPYREATQSGVVAAAFANGRPVVASRVGGLVDVIQDNENGVFVTAGSATALADALQRTLNDVHLRSRLSEGARLTAATQLNWDGIAEILLNGYAKAGVRVRSNCKRRCS